MNMEQQMETLAKTSVPPEILRSRILGAPVRLAAEEREPWRIKKLLVHSGTFRVIGFVLERRRSDDRVLPLAQTRFDTQTDIHAAAGALLPLAARVEFLHAARHPLPLLNSRVFTVSGVILGQMTDFSFQPTDGALLRLLLRDRQGQPAAADGRAIIAVSPHTILVKDIPAAKELAPEQAKPEAVHSGQTARAADQTAEAETEITPCPPAE